jgi:hypothetical protein
MKHSSYSSYLITICCYFLAASTPNASEIWIVESLSVNEADQRTLIEIASSRLGSESKAGVKDIEVFRDAHGYYGANGNVVGEVVYNTVDIDQNRYYFYSVRCMGPSWSDLVCDDIWQTKHILVEGQDSAIRIRGDIGFDEAQRVLGIFFDEDSVCISDDEEKKFSSLDRAWEKPELARDYQKYALRSYPSAYEFTVFDGTCKLMEIVCCSYD